MKRSGWGSIWLVGVAGLMILSLARPAIGLAGLGISLIISAVVVESQSGRVWREYRKTWKKQRAQSRWNQPREIYRWINIYLLWPLIFILGCLAVFAAIKVG